ncbi:hypothetical protein ACFYUV_21505 [Nonomuraea sp. NPDC003560]|uniref:hypothetical protein n=1 Tax=Nonomuraea sp. NPDC003560 TaxID=3364341 RepID=UPI0036CCE351
MTSINWPVYRPSVREAYKQRRTVADWAPEWMLGLLAFMAGYKEGYGENYKEEYDDHARLAGMKCVLKCLLTERGIEVPDDVRERIDACTEVDHLVAWTVRANAGRSLQQVFS